MQSSTKYSHVKADPPPVSAVPAVMLLPPAPPEEGPSVDHEAFVYVMTLLGFGDKNPPCRIALKEQDLDCDYLWTLSYDSSSSYTYYI